MLYGEKYEYLSFEENIFNVEKGQKINIIWIIVFFNFIG